MLQQASSLLHKYFQLSTQRRNKGQGAAQVEAVEAVDDGPRPQRQCLDLHPQCKLWQEKVSAMRGVGWEHKPKRADSRCLHIYLTGSLLHANLSFPSKQASKRSLVSLSLQLTHCCMLPCPLSLSLVQGECESNPKYMLGDKGANNGWCRAACGRCQRPADEGRYQGLPGELTLGCLPVQLRQRYSCGTSAYA